MSTQQLILSAAEFLFARHGYDNITIDQIARHAGLTKGAVYYFFQNKAELFCMVIDRALHSIEQQCLSLLEARRSGLEIARDIISFYVHLAYDNPNLFLILFGSRSCDIAIQSLFDPRLRRLLSCLQNIIRSGMEDGLLLPISPEILTRIFTGAIYGMLSLPDPPSREEAVQALHALLEKGIFQKNPFA